MSQKEDMPNLDLFKPEHYDTNEPLPERSEVQRKLIEALEIKKSLQTNFKEESLESYIDGKYSPKVIISSNDTSEFINISFQTLENKSLNIAFTKKSYAIFADAVNTFDKVLQTKKTILKG